MRASEDCIVVGDGPAGITAAIYLSRYHLSVTVFDEGCSRAASIPTTHNHAGFPEGISGPDLLGRMRAQAVMYGVTIRNCRVEALTREGGVWVASLRGGGTASARSVLVATGVTNNRPPMPDATHDEAVARGLLRYCPVCDGFEITDAAVGVFGQGERAFKETLFLRSYTRDVTLISTGGHHGLNEEQLRRLVELNIDLMQGSLTSIDLLQNSIQVSTSLDVRRFASIYPALGSVIHSQLTSAVGANLTEEGCVIVDNHQRTSMPGLYAAGDVVVGLDQISNAMGQGGVAATAIRNDLYALEALVR